MPQSCLAESLGRFAELTDTERAALKAIEGGDRHYRRGTVIRAERQAGGEMVLVQRGWLYCSMLLEDGRRQIIRLHFCGDLLGADSLVFADAPDSVTALTDAEVRVIDQAAFGRLFVDHPRLGALLFAMTQTDRVALTDRLTSLGRSSAKGRLAALLLWIAARLRRADPLHGYSFSLPLTQEEIGDITGLTSVHVNRTMRVLGEEGLIERSGGMLHILKPDRLARIANHVERHEKVDPGWLPAAR